MIIWSWNFVCVQKAMLCTHVKSFRLKFSSAQEVQFQKYTNLEKIFLENSRNISPRITEAQRYRCKYNFTAASFISLPRDLFYCRNFILLPRLLFYCREIYFTAASSILAPRVLFYCHEFYFAATSFIFTRAGASTTWVLVFPKW